jgi:hypothetical protein
VAAPSSRFADQIQPILIDHCYRCHGDGVKKGNVAFDQFGSDSALTADRDFWWAVLKNVRAGVMPPAGKPAPTGEQIGQLAAWIKDEVFQANPSDPDPGRVTIRRLNRVEYRNTIRDLTGMDSTRRYGVRIRHDRRCADRISVVAGKIPASGRNHCGDGRSDHTQEDGREEISRDRVS